MINLIIPINTILKLNTRLFINVLDGIDEEMAQKRANKKTNNIAFIALHILQARFYIATTFGIEAHFPFPELNEVKSVDEMKSFPELTRIKTLWQEISMILLDHMPQVREEELNAVAKQKFPIDDNSIFGTITFLISHEAYHIGQLGFLRKYFGLDAMRYT
jgi:hypothetical protein